MDKKGIKEITFYLGNENFQQIILSDNNNWAAKTQKKSLGRHIQSINT